jgi:hypothetical protein
MKLLALASSLVLSLAAASNGAADPLRPHPSNPRWLTDGSGRAIVLTGSHTWENGSRSTSGRSRSSTSSG